MSVHEPTTRDDVREGAVAPPAAESLEGFHLSPQQRRVWRLGADAGVSWRPGLAWELGLPGGVDPGRLRAALDAAVTRHEILRTTFHRLAGMAEPLQVIADDGRAALEVAEVAGEVEVEAAWQALAAAPFPPGAEGEGPLLRARLLVLSGGDARLLLAAHPLVFDAASLDVLWRDVARAYAGGEPAAEPMQYADVAEWLRELVASEEGTAARELWGSTAGAATAADGDRFAERLADGAAAEAVLRAERSAEVGVEEGGGPQVTAAADGAAELELAGAHRRLRALAGELSGGGDEAPTPETLTLAAWALLGRRLGEGSGDGDGADRTGPRLAATFSGRRAPELESGLGPLARELPIPLPADHADETFADFTVRLHAAHKEVWKRQEFFTWESATRESTEREPCCDLSLLWHEPAQGWRLGEDGGREIEVVPLRHAGRGDRATAGLTCLPRGDDLHLRLVVEPAAGGAATARLLLRRLTALLDAALERPRTPTAALPAMDEAEARALAAAADRTAEDRRMGGWEERFAAAVERHADRVAAGDGAVTLTFIELDRAVDRLAGRIRRHLRSRLDADADAGAGRAGESAAEPVVAVLTHRSVDSLVALLAVLRAGAVYLPIDADQPVARSAGLLADSGARLLLVHAATRDRVPEGAPPQLDLGSVGEDGDEDLAAAAPTPYHPRRLAYVLYTSGSTGRPKGVMVPHGALAAYLGWAVETYFGSGEEGSGRVLVHSPLGFDLTLTGLLAPLLAGDRVELLPEERGLAPLVAALDDEEAGEVAFLKLTPAHLRALAAGGNSALLARAGVLVVGGEALAGEALVPLGAAATRVVNEYGPTETVVGCILHEARRPFAGGGAVPIGRPAPGVASWLLDRRGRPVPAGVVGELHVGGAQVTRGYLGRPALTAEAFVPDGVSGRSGARLYRTGDLAVLDADGELVYRGRRDEQVKVRGFRVEPGEVEAVLTAHPAVAQAAVVHRGRDDGGHGLVAFWVAEADVPVPAGDELRSHLAGRLAEPMVPSHVERLDALPLTANGKVDRKALAGRPVGTAAAGGYAAPRNELEARMAAVWRELLRVERVGIHDSFFQLGGDSILSIQAVARLGRAGIELTPRQMFERPTIAGLAEVAGRRAEAEGEVVETAQGGPVPLTPIQRRFFADGLAEPHHYNHALLLAVRGDLAGAPLRAAVEALVRHHDALRLRFRQQDGEGWSQHLLAAGEAPPAAVHRLDLSALPAARRRSAVEAATARVQGSLDLGAGPLLRVAHLSLGEDEGDGDGGTDGGSATGGARLLVVVHHLAVDGVSWWTLLSDLETAYRQAAAGRPPQLPPASPFARWARVLESAAGRPPVAGQLDAWRRHLDADLEPLPLDHPQAADPVSRERAVDVALDRDETADLLRRAPRAYGTRADELLLAAVAAALHAWTGGPVLVDLEGHGRAEELADGLDLSRTVGWFTAVHPVLLRPPAGDAPGNLVVAVKETLRSLPRPAAGWGVLRHLGDRPTRAALAGLPGAEVSFNYLGQLDQALAEGSAFAPAAEGAGPSVSPRQRRRYPLAVEAAVADGRLQVSFRYGADRLERATVEALAGRFLDVLRRLVEHCAGLGERVRTPSDFPLAEIDRPALAALLAEHPDTVDLYPLTPSQQGMLFHSLAEATDDDSAADAYLERLTGRLSGDLDRDAFVAAWRRAVARHPVLRSGFHWDLADRPLQRVDAAAEPEVTWLDWREVPDDERRRRFAERVAEEGRRGFDLSRPPLLRLTLVRVADDVHRFVWTHHHLLLDGWSTGRLFLEILEGYRLALGPPASDPGAGSVVERAPAPPFRDYVTWLDGRDREAEEAVWRRALEGFTAPTPPPAARQAPRTDLEGGEPRSDRLLQLGEAASDGLRALARRSSLTLSTVMQGAWALLLGRYARRRDVAFGLTLAGRPAELPGVEEMLGLFINTVPVRTALPGDAALGPWLGDLQGAVAELREHGHASLVDVHGWSELAAGEPLFETLLVFENYPLDEVLTSPGDAPLVVDELLPVENTHYPLTLVVAPAPRLAVRALYDRRRYDDEAVESLLDHLRVLLEAMAADGAETAPLAGLPLMDEAERRRVLVEDNDTAVDWPPGAGVHRLVDAAAADPEAVAVEAGDEGRLTYGELLARADRLAAVLRRRGVGPDRRVALGLEPGADLVVAVLAVLRAGGAYVPLDPAYPAARLGLMLADSGATVLLVRPGAAERFTAGLDQPPALLSIAPGDAGSTATDDGGLADAGLPADVPPEALAYVIYTSGSTGRPKGVAMTHGALTNLVRWQLDAWRREEGGGAVARRTAQLASPSFDVSFQEMLTTWAAGGTLVLVPPAVRRDPVALLAHLRSRRVERLFLPYVALRNLAEAGAGLGEERPADLRQVITAGEQLKVTPEVRRWFAGDDAPRLDNQYGPSESHVVSSHLLAADPAGWPELPPIGRPVANTRLYVLGPDLAPLPIGVEGELFLAGAALGRGYLERPAATAAAFLPDPFADAPGGRLYRTGDLVRRRSDGDLDFLGRADAQVKVRGFRVEPGEVEVALAEHPGVREAVVVAHGGGAGTALVAYLLAADGDAPPAEAELRRHLGERLPEHMVPSHFVTVDELPLTPSGKVDRRALPAPWDEAAEAGRGAAPAGLTGDASVDLMAGLWRQVLGREDVGPKDDFFALGGHSLVATRLVSRVRRTFGVELPLRALFEAPTVAGLARRVEAARGTGGEPLPPVEPCDDDGPAPLAASQRRLWYLHRVSPDDPAYNVTSASRLVGPLSVAALLRALGRVVERHATLRTRFAEAADGEPVQVVEPAGGPPALPRADLGGLPPSLAEAELRRLSGREAARPFDLRRAPLLRGTLVRLPTALDGTPVHVLLLALHHVVTDGWSMGVLVRDLGELYRAELAGRAAVLPELPVTYADFARWQQRWLAGEGTAAQVDYWRRRLADPPAPLELPGGGRRRPETRDEADETGSAGDLLGFRLDAEVSAGLVDLARQRGATLYMVLLAAFQVLLHHLSGRLDLTVGTPVANRRRPEVEELVGFFVNTLVLRADLAGDPSFGELVARSRDTVLGAFAHQDVPFDRLVEELRPDRSVAASPLFQVWFVLQEPPAVEAAEDGLVVLPMVAHGGAVRHDLILDVSLQEGRVGGSFGYRTDLFTAADARRFRDLFAALAAAVVAAPETPLSALSERLAEADERRRGAEKASFREGRRGELSRLRRRGGGEGR